MQTIEQALKTIQNRQNPFRAAEGFGDRPNQDLVGCRLPPDGPRIDPGWPQSAAEMDGQLKMDSFTPGAPATSTQNQMSGRSYILKTKLFGDQRLL